MLRDDGDINIARIPVSGIGGLGLVAAAAGVAFAIGLLLIGTRHRRARRAAEIGGLILVLAVAVGLWIYLR